MSVLAPPIIPKEVFAKKDAEKIKEILRQSFELFKSTYEHGLRTLWIDKQTQNGESYGPSEVLVELGPDAVEIFQLTKKLTDFLEDIEPGCATSILQKYYREVTYNLDGTVELIIAK